MRNKAWMMRGKDRWVFLLPFKSSNKRQHRNAEVICMQKQQTDMKPISKADVFAIQRSCDKAESSKSATQPSAPEPHAAWELTVMTDTPAEVLLSLGPVLKCFLIFPATDSWLSFSDTPSSWEIQTKSQRQICLHACSRLILLFWTHIDPWMIEHLHGCISLIHLHLEHPSDQGLENTAC